MLTVEAPKSVGVVETAHRRHVPYRTAFVTRLDYRDASVRVLEQFRVWLRSKANVDLNRFDVGETTVGQNTVVLYAATNEVTGWQLRERQGNGLTWVSTAAVTRGDPGRGAWVSLNVEAVATEGNPPMPDRPRLIGLLLDALDAYDGEAVLRSRPELVTESRVDYLLDVVRSDARRLPTVVAAPPPDLAFVNWRCVVDEVTRNLPGLASIYLLDPVAAEAFNRGIGSMHRIGPGAARTYLPGVDPAIAEDAVRHRVLGWRRIQEDPRRASRLIAFVPRRLAAGSVPPCASAGLDLSRRDFTRSRTAVAQAPDPVLAELRERVALLENLLEEADASEREAKATNARQQDELLDLAGELEVARDETERLGIKVRTLQRRLVVADRHTDAYAPPEEEPALPKDFGDLLDRIPELGPFVVFTGDREHCLGLDEHAQSSTWSQVAWQTLLAMRDYVRTRREVGFDGDFKRWCQSPPDGGRAVSPGKVPRGESDSVRNSRRMAAMRTFPVPVEVHPAGDVFMGAHVRLGQSSTVAPRMHFHDASSDHGTIYVGYIGRHLENARTS